MNDLDEYQLQMLVGMRYLIRHGKYDLDMMPDTWYNRAAYWITSHAGMLVTSSVFLGAGILVYGLGYIFSLPW